ncbi:lipase/serine esteras-like protein [Dothidotthia symphoricarpi CBS 119687]|uniref:Lipase/serine esteras-like protein n=1 Tax=Dothidotthia symphoricarpi CBS 119687 TaxID=1392245 RepID=A0A6A6A716_9PLEO|nr:lipase/serine esteras-like protein [Dothidotthia symphoricarpi CBS 119687]KAF2126864.1 lipase/serine esteras-like protein [Dothidotthia symphoricarpi CBS 119687]
MVSPESSHTSMKADHLAVLVHGLWGNPDHLKYLTTSLRERFPEENLDILVPKNNAGSFTYDGIELGGERVASEVCDRLEELAKNGHNITKISVIGYSLGGLIARFCIGILYHRGVFEKIQPVNFTTFATPHLGVRTPLRGYHSHVWNVLGARTLSMSGRQLFGVDRFRDTGRPLLAVLADPESIFIQALAQFKHRSLYANIVNDRTVTYYTAGISQTDPFVNPEGIKINYIPGYDDVIIDSENPVSAKEPEPLPALTQRLTSSTRTIFGRIPIAAALIVFIPIGTTLFLVNSAIQSFRSSQRIRLHEAGRGGIDIGTYRIPLMIRAARQEVEEMFESAHDADEQDYLMAGNEEMASPTQPTSPTHARTTSNSDVDSTQEQKREPVPEFPTLALSQDQFKMIEALDHVGFNKHAVHIHNHRHTHAAIIVRMDKKSFDEGRVVVRHWLDNFDL